jgi:hypothetical protein
MREEEIRRGEERRHGRKSDPSHKMRKKEGAFL